MIPFKPNFSSVEQGMSGGICIFIAKRKRSNLPFGVMMSSMALHGIVMQYKNADARGRTGGRGRTPRTLWATMGRCGGRQGGGVRCTVPLYDTMVLFVVESSRFVDVYVHVLSNPGTTHGNADGVTRGRARRDAPCTHSR